MEVSHRLRSVDGLPYLCDMFPAHSCLVFLPPAQIPHWLTGFWLSDPVFGPGHQSHSGVPRSQVERSEDLIQNKTTGLLNYMTTHLCHYHVFFSVCVYIHLEYCC